MIEKILNGLGLYTEKQWNMALKKIGELREENFELKKLEKENEKLRETVEDKELGIGMLSEEFEKLKNDHENVVAALKVCEEEKSELLSENDDLKRFLENRKKQVDFLLNDFERVSEENEELKKEIERLRLKVARSVKRRVR